MQIKNGTCKLCNNEEIVFYDSRITQHVKSTFLSSKEVSAKDLEKFYTCPTCAYKIQLSGTIKKNYGKASSRKENRFSRNCIFCLKKAKEDVLLEADDNPTDFKSHINKLLKPLDVLNFKKSLVCLECLFGINVWMETHNGVRRVMGISGKDDLENNNSSIITPDRDTIVLSDTEESKRKLRSTRRTNLNRDSPTSDVEFVSETPYIRKSSRIAVLPEASKEAISSSHGKPLRRNRLKLKWTTYLKKRLKPFSSLKEIKNVNYDVTIKYDRKMYLNIPYINITMNSQIAENILDSSEVISSDDDKVSKLSNNFNSFPDYDINQYLCHVCDRSFTTRCAYLAHSIKHEKIEDVIINIKRLNMSKNNDVTKRRKKTNLLPDEVVDRLLVKYLGDDYTILNDTNVSKENNSVSPKSKRKVFQFKINFTPKRKRKLADTENDAESEREEQKINDEIIEDKAEQENKEGNDMKQCSSGSDMPEISPLRLENSEIEEMETENSGNVAESTETPLQNKSPSHIDEDVSQSAKCTLDLTQEVIHKQSNPEEISSQITDTEEGSLVHNKEVEQEETTSERDVASKDSNEETHEEVQTTDATQGNEVDLPESEGVKERNQRTAIVEKTLEIENSTEEHSNQTLVEGEASKEAKEVESSPCENMQDSQSEMRDAVVIHESSNTNEEDADQPTDLTEDDDNIESSNTARPRNQKKSSTSEVDTEQEECLTANELENIEQTSTCGLLEVTDDNIENPNTCTQPMNPKKSSTSEADTEQEECLTAKELENIEQTSTCGLLEVTDETRAEDIGHKELESKSSKEVIDTEVCELELLEARPVSPTLTKSKNCVGISKQPLEGSEEKQNENDISNKSKTPAQEVAVEDDLNQFENGSASKKCLQTISLLDGEEITIEESVTEYDVNERCLKKSFDETVEDSEETLFQEMTQNDDATSSQSDGMSTSEKAAMKQVEMLGEVVVFIADSDSESTEEEVVSPIALSDEVEQDSSKTGKTHPIMTNEDLLNILEDEDGNSEEIVDKKRKRKDSVTDSNLSKSKTSRLETEDNSDVTII